VPERPLNAKESLQFHQDGFVFVPSLVTNQKLLKQIAEDVWKVQGIADLGPSDRPHARSDDWCGGSRALAHSDLILSMAASASTGFSAANLDLCSAGAWAKTKGGSSKGGSWQGSTNFHMYHYDSVHHRPYLNASAYHCQQITVWLVVQGGMRPLELVKGSHKFREELSVSKCAHWYAPALTNWNTTYAQFDTACVSDFMEEHGYPNAVWSTDMKLGDAIIFTGDVLHSGLIQDEDRIAIAFKYMTPNSKELCIHESKDYVPPGIVTEG
jgi:hypothetical protein